jgi:cytochrome c-type biogenesis protein CcmH
MTSFWLICALLLLVAVLFLVLPLWRSGTKNTTVLRDAANLDIFRDQIAEMDADLRNGLLTAELYEQGKRELQARLLDEVKGGEETAKVRNPHKITALVLALLLPAIALGMYWKLGNREALEAPAARPANAAMNAQPAPIDLSALETKVASQPNDHAALAELARGYAEAERYPEAIASYEKLVKLEPNNATWLADYADATAIANGESLKGKPSEILQQALKVDPNNYKALALSGSAAMERGEYDLAMQHWDKLLKLMPKGSEDAKMVESGIQQAKEFIAQLKSGKNPTMPEAPPQGDREQSPALVGGAERITGTVSLSKELAGKVKPDDLVFILARAAEGPKMPLAVIRKQVKDLPLQFTLDNSQAMAPQMKLSNFDSVVVVARISKTGNAMPQTGDLQGISAPMKPGSSGVKLSVDKVVE